MVNMQLSTFQGEMPIQTRGAEHLDIGLMLAHSLRRWPNNQTALG